jgi:hypothetical protein
MPSQNPINAGRKENAPRFSDCSIAGIRRLQTDAATITPAANPVSARCTLSLSVSFIRNTHAAPNDVPKNGIKIPQNTFIICPFLIFYTFCWKTYFYYPSKIVGFLI